MTTLDLAFIKAFTDTASHPAAPHATPIAPRPRIVKSTSRPAHAVAPPFAVVHPEESALGELGARNATLPLSSFAPQTRVDDACRALLEIDRAAWPEACGDLLLRASRDWDRFAEQLIERMGQGQKCIALVSLARGEGRPTVALALAKHVAGRGLRPVIVDADTEKPALARTCGVSAHTGWDDLVSSELPLGEALITAVEDGVTLMPWRGPAAAVSKLAQSPRIGSIFGTLREHYDLVLLDTTPFEGPTAITDFAGFAAAIHLDSLYLIQDLRTTTHEGLIAACSKLRRCGLPLSGVIENFVSPTSLDKPPVRGASPAVAGRNRVGARPLTARIQ
jgi:Mrp family chromosome partitioning ATPase